VVYTRGRVSDGDQDYRATVNSEYTNFPMVTLVNRNSASASEIVSGALQDHDRSIVVGETTFGKALVQSVYKISGGAGLALTSARYYTPSGRLIQRPWDGTFDEYLTYSLRDQNPQREHSAAQLKKTDAGRDVYSGGGIDPDKFMVGSVEGFNPSRFGRTLVGRGAFANFADQFTAEGDTRLSAANKNKKPIAKGFQLTDAMMAEFRESLKPLKVVIDDAAFSKDEQFIRAMIHFDIDQALFGVAEARRNLIGKDPQAQFALSQFPDAVRLTQLTARKQ
jgi:carboxyl-terminal processing protease